MKIALSLFILLSSKAFACDFALGVDKVFSLSGPVTVALRELKLLSSPKLKGISVFHPIRKEDFTGEILPGGLYLSRSTLDSMSGGVVFHDQGRELSKMLREISGIRSYEIKTRGLTPEESVRSVYQQMKLTLRDCDQEAQAMIKKSQDLSSELVKALPKTLTAVFYLGEMTQVKKPELVMVQDGIVRWLRARPGFKTYPSELAYVSWSAKIMSGLAPGFLEVGVKDSGREMKQGVQRLSSTKFNLIFPGALVPGITQQEAWLLFLKSI